MRKQSVVFVGRFQQMLVNFAALCHTPRWMQRAGTEGANRPRAEASLRGSWMPMRKGLQ